MNIGIILTTRGFVFTEVMQSLLKELEGYEYEIFMSHNLPIPECQNTLIEKALLGDFTHFLFIEEDVVIPEGAVDDMMMAKGDIVAIDYGVNEWSCITRYKDEILWCGLGCTLVKREVFEGMERPFFRSDKALLLNDWPNITWIDAGKQAYGGQDIYFCMKAREKGFTIQQVFGEARHLKLEELGRREINNGHHCVLDKPRISKHNKL